MKKLFAIFAVSVAAVMLSGCASYWEANNKAVAQLYKQMSPEWLKANIVTGKTTPAEVTALFGQPVFKHSSAGTGFVAAFMPDERWTYSVRFTSSETTARETKSIVFSFKNGTVSDYNVSSMAF
jgi:hypothetical protein